MIGGVVDEGGEVIGGGEVGRMDGGVGQGGGAGGVVGAGVVVEQGEVRGAMEGVVVVVLVADAGCGGREVGHGEDAWWRGGGVWGRGGKERGWALVLEGREGLVSVGRSGAAGREGEGGVLWAARLPKGGCNGKAGVEG